MSHAKEMKEEVEKKMDDAKGMKEKVEKKMNDAKEVKRRVMHQIKKIEAFQKKIDKIVSTVQLLRLDITKTVVESKSEIYYKIFKEVDVSGDGQVDFDEFRNLINKTLKLNLSNQRMKDLFAASDKNGEGQLNAKEFEGAMKKLEAVIVDVGLRKLGLTEHSLIPLGIFLVLYMVLLITFILTGFAAFTPGTAFGAGVGSLLPLIAGKTAGIGNLIENVDFKEYIEKVLKEDFQN